MGLTDNAANQKNAGETDGSEEKLGGKKISPVLIVLFVLALAGSGYWVFVHQNELKERFFPSDSADTVQTEEMPEEKTSFLSRLIKKDRTIVVRGTLLGEEGGAAVLINKKVLPQGTWINGMRILEITNQSIVIQSGGVKRRLQVGETFDPDEE